MGKMKRDANKEEMKIRRKIKEGKKEENRSLKVFTAVSFTPIFSNMTPYHWIIGSRRFE